MSVGSPPSMDAFQLTLVGRDRTYSTVLFEYGDRRVVAHVANDDHCVLPATFARLRDDSAQARRVSGARVEAAAASPGPESLKGAA